MKVKTENIISNSLYGISKSALTEQALQLHIGCSRKACFANLKCDNDEVNISSRRIFDIFKEYKSHPFIFVEPGGNHGDCLIRKGAQKLANIAGINYQTVDNSKFMESKYPEDSVIYIHGGGGYVPCWSGTPGLLKKAITTHSGIAILGPTTFSTDTLFLKNILDTALNNIKSKKVIIFARERVSFRTLKTILPAKVEIGLDHDTALNLNRTDFLTAVPKSRYILYAVRKDKESVAVATRNLLSVWLDPIRYHLNFKEWVFLHSRARKIITNRCHSAILGTVLGIPVIILPNNYHKNRSIWEYSLSGRGVQWLDNIPGNRIASMINATSLLRKLAASYVCQSALKLYYGMRYKDLHSPVVEKIVSI